MQYEIEPLKACRFCGSKDVEYECALTENTVRCNSCKVRVSHPNGPDCRPTKDDSIAAWNRDKS